jgi:methyltransferase (TIGR00027 family)
MPVADRHSLDRLVPTGSIILGVTGRGASRTAVFVCQGRAVADGRLAVGRFGDPVSAKLLRPEERMPVQTARSATRPADWRERVAVESLVSCAEVVVPRTVAIDEAIREAGHRQVVVLGAGLDSRPWRLAELADAVLFAVDHPSSQADVRDRSAGLVPLCRRLELVAADLSRDSLGAGLGRASHDPSAPTTWIWEGVVPYLAPAEVETTLAAVRARSALGSVLVVQYQTRAWLNILARRLAGLTARLARLDNPLADEPWRSLWTAARMAELLGRHGFTVRSDEDLLAIADRIGSPAGRRRSLAAGRVAIATSKAPGRSLGVALHR